MTLDCLDYEIYLFGYSVGGVITPILAEMLPTVIKGLIVFDTILSNLKLYLLKNRIRQETLQGYSKEYMVKSNKEYEELLEKLLCEKKSPRHIVEKNTEFSKYFSEHEKFMGHIYSYAQQLSDLDLWKVWSKIGLPVVIVVGERDDTIDYEDHVKLYQILKRKNEDGTIFLSAPVNHFFAENDGNFSVNTLKDIRKAISKIFEADLTLQ